MTSPKKVICALLHWYSSAMGPVQQGSIAAEHYNHLPLYSIHSHPTLHWTLIVNLIYWFAQSVPTFSGSTTQPSPVPHVLYSAKPRPYLGLHPCGAVHNTMVRGMGLKWSSKLQSFGASTYPCDALEVCMILLGRENLSELVLSCVSPWNARRSRRRRLAFRCAWARANCCGYQTFELEVVPREWFSRDTSHYVTNSSKQERLCRPSYAAQLK